MSRVKGEVADRGGDGVRIEGARAVLEAIRAGRREVRAVFLAEGPGSSGSRELEELARSRGIPIRMAPLSGLRAAAEADPFPEEPFEALLVDDRPRFLVALDRVTDVGNLGSIARSAECAGVTGLVLEHRHAPPVEPGALRVSAGALEYLRVGRTPRLKNALELASREGVRVLAAEPGGYPIDQVAPELLAADLALVFGSEERGIRGPVRELAECRVGVPLAGRVGSLGVAAAAAYLLLRIAEVRRAAGLARGPSMP
jgi:23S rRNA (guanosine2251-2'-O)-methyltransferase